MRTADGAVAGPAPDPDVVRPATREEKAPVMMLALLAGFVALIVSFTRGYVLLYGDAVAHLGIARRIFDSRDPGWGQLGGVWLPLPHLLMLPFVQSMTAWQSGLAGAWPSLLCYVFSVAGFYRLCRRMLVPRWAMAATAFYGLNPNLLYLSTTAMTEPLFLLLMIWMTVLTVECVDAIAAADEKLVRRRLLGLGWVIFAAVFTRYDGWVLGALAWLVVAWYFFRSEELRQKAKPGFAIFTALVVAGPLLWLLYNQHFYGDPLDFLRGPYSASAIEKRTRPEGSWHYFGWHNLQLALVYYLRTVRLDAAAWETGFYVLLMAFVGWGIAMWRRMAPAAALLWVPLGFYAYSVAYGSVPIFIPELWPFSYYNSRYGMQLLPALALFAAIAAAEAEKRLTKPSQTGTDAKVDGKARVRPLYLAVLALILVNPLAMIFGGNVVQWYNSHRHRETRKELAYYNPPLVLKEALVNSATRIPFERNLALVLEQLPQGASILMAESAHIGAVQDAGIPLKQTINEADSKIWKAALQDPAGKAAYVIAMDGDPVAKAVAEHSGGLDELSIICTTGQPCARIYQSQRYMTQGVPVQK